VAITPTRCQNGDNLNVYKSEIGSNEELLIIDKTLISIVGNYTIY